MYDDDEKPPIQWLRIHKASHLARIAAFVRKQPLTINTYSGPRLDRKGGWVIMFGYDTKPDSDWGRYSGHRAGISFGPREALAVQAEADVRRALGWKVEA